MAWEESDHQAEALPAWARSWDVITHVVELPYENRTLVYERKADGAFLCGRCSWPVRGFCRHMQSVIDLRDGKPRSAIATIGEVGSSKACFVCGLDPQDPRCAICGGMHLNGGSMHFGVSYTTCSGCGRTTSTAMPLQQSDGRIQEEALVVRHQFSEEPPPGKRRVLLEEWL